MVKVLFLAPRGASAAAGAISSSFPGKVDPLPPDEQRSALSIRTCFLERDVVDDRSFRRIATGSGRSTVACGSLIGGGSHLSVSRRKVGYGEYHVCGICSLGLLSSSEIDNGGGICGEFVGLRRMGCSSSTAGCGWNGESSLRTSASGRGMPRGAHDAAEVFAFGSRSPSYRSAQSGTKRRSLVVLAEYGAGGKGWGLEGRGGGGGGGGGGERFHDSLIVQKEAEQIFNDFRLLSGMQPKFFNFDFEGKRIFVDKMEDFLERLKIFTTRYRLSSDPEAREVLRRLDAQLLEGGLTMDTMYAQLKKTVELMREELNQEEKMGPAAAAELATARAVMEGYSSDKSHPAYGMRNLAALMDDPEVLEALAEPEVLSAVQEVLRNPSSVSKYANNPKVASLLLKIFSKTSGETGM